MRELEREIIGPEGSGDDEVEEGGQNVYLKIAKQFMLSGARVGRAHGKRLLQYVERENDATFKDVAGLGNIRLELEEIVKFFTLGEMSRRRGVKIPGICIRSFLDQGFWWARTRRYTESGRGDVIKIAATNRPDILDPALVRPGRFGRKIYIPKPSLIGHVEILKVHAQKKPMADDIDYMAVANVTEGMVGAELANIIEIAAINMTRDGRS